MNARLVFQVQVPCDLDCEHLPWWVPVYFCQEPKSSSWPSVHISAGWFLDLLSSVNKSFQNAFQVHAHGFKFYQLFFFFLVFPQVIQLLMFHNYTSIFQRQTANIKYFIIIYIRVVLKEIYILTPNINIL